MYTCPANMPKIHWSDKTVDLPGKQVPNRVTNLSINITTTIETDLLPEFGPEETVLGNNNENHWCMANISAGKYFLDHQRKYVHGTTTVTDTYPTGSLKGTWGVGRGFRNGDNEANRKRRHKRDGKIANNEEKRRNLKFPYATAGGGARRADSLH